MSTDQDLVQCAELRHDEWTVLSSVYPEYTTRCEGPQPDQTSPVTIRLEVPVDFDGERGVEVALEENPSGAPDEQSHQEPATLNISNLPPLLITLLLPPTYPLRVTPLLIHFHSTNSYLRAVDVETIHKKLMDLWEEDLDAGTGTLWRTCEWLRSGTFLEDIGLAEPLQPIRLVHPRPILLAERLKDHNNTVKFNTFSQAKFDCQICLSSVRGAQCIRLDCLHVFCRPCLTDFWSLCIAEGDVDRVTCADPQCVKENRPVTEDEVLRVVSESETRRWKELKRKRALEKDPGLVYCPIAFCQSPCPTPQVQRDAKDRESESMDDVNMRRKYLSLRTCDNCEFAFCILCKRSWHGLAPCSSDVTTRFLEQYMALSDDDPEKLTLELRFGKAQLKRLVAVFQEEQENKRWLRESTTNCPNCLVSVEKSTGCNHMTCGRCSTHFCYLCGLKLPGDRPYDHFSAPGPCKGQLFQFANWEPNEDELRAFAED